MGQLLLYCSVSDIVCESVCLRLRLLLDRKRGCAPRGFSSPKAPKILRIFFFFRRDQNC